MPVKLDSRLIERANNAAEAIKARAKEEGWPEVGNAIAAYLREGREPSGFVLAVLEGRLFDAACKADSQNVQKLGLIARAVRQELPLMAIDLGQPIDTITRVDEWCDAHSQRQFELAREQTGD